MPRYVPAGGGAGVYIDWCISFCDLDMFVVFVLYYMIFCLLFLVFFFFFFGQTDTVP